MFVLYNHLLPFTCPKYSAAQYGNCSARNPISVLLGETVTLPSKEHQRLKLTVASWGPQEVSSCRILGSHADCCKEYGKLRPPLWSGGQSSLLLNGDVFSFL
jgi:hypothetical protein